MSNTQSVAIDTTQNVVVIGAGMAGLSCASSLESVGYKVTLLDKARGPGGRMSTRRIETPLGGSAFDHGAQYFTVRNAGFREQVLVWETAGAAIRWPAAGADAWIGNPGMNAVIKAIAVGRNIHWQSLAVSVERKDGGWLVQTNTGTLGPFHSIAVAIPAEQAQPLILPHEPEFAAAAGLARSLPCWSAMFTFATPLPVSRDILRDRGPIGWAARNSAKPGRSGPEAWVVQGSAQWSENNLEVDADKVAACLLAEFAIALEVDLPEPLTATAHRWRYAQSAALGFGALWNSELRLGVCGDWLLGPRVECAWLSGQQLARSMCQ